MCSPMDDGGYGRMVMMSIPGLQYSPHIRHAKMWFANRNDRKTD